MPRHVGQRTIDKEEEKHHEEHVSRKAYTLSKRARDQRGRDDGKLHLEEGEQCQGYRRTTQYIASGCGIDGPSYPMEHRERQGIADHTTDVVAKTQREADHHPEDRNQSHGDKRLQHGRDDILRPHHTTIEERQTWRHHQHENSGRDQPSHIGCGYHRPVTLECRFTYKHTCEGNQCHCRHQDLPTFFNLHISLVLRSLQ